MAIMRLQKWMAQCGVASRRQSERLIAEGRVHVNGEVVHEQGMQVDTKKDHVHVDGVLLTERASKVYYMFYKPAGVVTTTCDPKAECTIFDVLPELKGRVVPVGRLDKDTRGLLILTNDGELTHRLTHPSWQVPKTYRAVVHGKVEARALKRLATGIQLEDGVTAPATVRLLRKSSRRSTLELTIHEGKKREVRRMLRAVGHPVEELLRIRFGGLTLEKISEGQYRPLRPHETEALRRIVEL